MLRSSRLEFYGFGTFLLRSEVFGREARPCRIQWCELELGPKPFRHYGTPESGWGPVGFQVGGMLNNL